MENTDILDILESINPSQLEYQEWLNVGMALKTEGYACDAWDKWSMRDFARYHKGECERKWNGFRGSGTPVTAGTIVQYAKNQGWHPERQSYELDWDSEIGGKQNDDFVVVDKKWIDGKDIVIPKTWDPVRQLITYIETLFDSTENVGYVTDSWEKDGKYLPSKGAYDRTAGQLIQELSKCSGDIGAVIGDYKKEAGAWIRFNPLDGKGVRDENVTDYRFALVESDNEDIEKQNAILRELELPIACLVYSGKKSIHAIVKIDADNYSEYRKRVDFLYSICQKNGLKIDVQNRNPSRLSRMPGVERNGQKQYLLDTNIGKESFAEWREWIESVNDNLPEPESLCEFWDDLPELAPPLIDGVLRQGHKMLIAGPSKAGKSYALIELCCAVAEGREWFGWSCAQGKILYVNLELDRASCLHRFKDVYSALGWEPENIDNIDIWNLRGQAIPMDKLAPKLIRRSIKKNYIAIVIDPIYKVITGDENSADQMANFCNQFDKVCNELGCAVIYCHHHSKGAQGGKRSMDRASGSGVFARDPDALIDLIELELDDNILKQQADRRACEVCARWLKEQDAEEPSQDELCSRRAMFDLCKEYLGKNDLKALEAEIQESEDTASSRTAWRIEGTLREFPRFAPVNVWFDFPVHSFDESGVLGDVNPDDGYNGKGSPYRKNFGKKKSPEERQAERREALETAFEACGIGEEVTVADLAEYMGVSEKTMRRRLKEHGGFWIDEGTIGKR